MDHYEVECIKCGHVFTAYIISINKFILNRVKCRFCKSYVKALVNNEYMYPTGYVTKEQRLKENKIVLKHDLEREPIIDAPIYVGDDDYIDMVTDYE